MSKCHDILCAGYDADAEDLQRGPDGNLYCRECYEENRIASIESRFGSID